MSTQRRPGMDHSIYPFSPIVSRAPYTLPDDKPVAVYIVLHIEHWELLQPPEAYKDPRFRGEFPAFDPDYRSWSYRAYGNRVGLYRILDLFDRLQLPVTAAIGAGALDAHPELVDEIGGRRYEIVAHGLTANRMITSRMTEDEERSHILESRDAITQGFSTQPEGWLGQDFGTTPRTSRLLADLGFRYTLDWANDEQPYYQENGRIVALPAPSEWDDAQTFMLRKVPVDRLPTLMTDGLDEMARSGSNGARVMALGVHPWVLGAPHRFVYLKKALEALVKRDDVLLTTAGELARIFRDAR